MKNFNGLFVLPLVYKGHPEGNNDCIINQKGLKVKSGGCLNSKYQLDLPMEEELRAEIEKDVLELKREIYK